jgi:hypothetical protein
MDMAWTQMDGDWVGAIPGDEEDVPALGVLLNEVAAKP